MNLGMPEIMIILVIALIVFGPRKLPELGKSLGKAMAQFRRASEDFKRTWEQEVELERSRPSQTVAATTSSTPNYSADSSYYHTPNEDGTSHYSGEAATASSHEQAESHAAAATETAAAAAPRQEPQRAQHWI